MSITAGTGVDCKKGHAWTETEIQAHQSEEFEQYREYYEIKTDGIKDVQIFLIWKRFNIKLT